MDILIDMNLTARWVQFLRLAGHNAEHWSSIGPGAADDVDICEFARQRGDVILTNDLDFPQILGHTHQVAPSIMLLRGQPLVPETRGAAPLRAIEDCEAELLQGAIVSLDWSDRPRAKVLPL